MTSLVLEFKPGERIVIGGLVIVELVKKSGQTARVRVQAPAEVEVKKDSGHLPGVVARMTG